MSNAYNPLADMTPATPSVADLRRRASKLEVQIPASVIEKDELIEFVQSAELRLAPTPKLIPPGSVAELKGRLKELCFEIPSTIVEKSELVALVAEAERHAKNEAPRPAIAKSRTVPAVSAIPEPWYKKESRSYPGSFYFVNAETGGTAWDLPNSAHDGEQHNGQEGQPLEPIIDSHKHKLDYRDDVFVESSTVASAVAQERPWSRSGAMSCSRGVDGVTSLTLADCTRQEDESPAILSWSATSAPTNLHGSRISWMKGEMIGHGALGRVFKALDQLSGQFFAVKEVAIDSRDEKDKAFMDALNNEVKIMQDLDHANIVRFLGHDHIESFFYIYMEHMEGGSVTQALQQYGAFDECLIRNYSKQLLSGLEYLHTQTPPVIHRDIKGPNILIGLDSAVKLADFGCSKKSEVSVTHTMRGSIPWMAPEVLVHSRHGRASDIWSFGCVVIEMGTALTPWGHFENQMAAVFRIGLSEDIPPLPGNSSATCRDFILSCLKRDPADRWAAARLLDHSFLQET